jgi:hypothetical protein
MLTRRDLFKLAAAGIITAGTSLALPSTRGVALAASGPVSRCLWLSWDGADIRSIEQLMGLGLLPNLSRLNVVRLIASPNTATKAGHAEALSGQGCDRTNVISNKRFNSRLTADQTAFYKVRQVYPDRFLSCIFSKPAHTGDQVCGGRRQPWYHLRNWALAGGLDRYYNPSTDPDSEGDLSLDYTNQRLAEHAAACQASGAPGFMVFCHWAEPDHSGHQHGMGSAEWDDRLIRLDAALGWAVSELQPEAVFVYSDHGFDDFGALNHNNAPNGFLASNHPLIANGLRWDVPVTVLKTLGLPVETYEPVMNGRDLRL